MRNKKVVASTGQGSWSELETVRTTVHLPDLTIRESTGCRFVYRITKIIVVAVGSTGGSNVPSDKNELSQKEKRKKKEKRKGKKKGRETNYCRKRSQKRFNVTTIRYDFEMACSRGAGAEVEAVIGA